jgi:hypothetical protein
MNRILIGLAASAAILSLSTGAFASTHFDKSDTGTNYKNGLITLAQATGGNPNSGQGPAVSEPSEQVGGKRKTEADMPAPEASPNATDTTGSIDEVDASQSKRKDTSEPTQSGSK